MVDFYKAKKANNHRFSYRMFAQRAGYSSSGLYQNIINGKNNLTPYYIPKFAKAMDLKGKELQYLKFLVEYNHEDDENKKKELLVKMKLLMPEQFKVLENYQREYYRYWYITAIHQSLQVYDIKENYYILAENLYPRVSLDNVKSAMEILKKLGMIFRNDKEYWKPSFKTLIGGQLVGKDVIRKFQNEMIGVAQSANLSFDRTEKYITTQTIATSQKALIKIQEILEDSRQKIREVIYNENKIDCVFQINNQIFPLLRNEQIDEVSNG